MVFEIYYDGYKVKRMEVGVVVVVVFVENVVRKFFVFIDSIIIIGGKIGRDGCGGVIGFFKEYNDKLFLLCGVEV